MSLPITKDIRYKICKFQDQEITEMSTELQREKNEWKEIQEKKKMLSEINQPYFEEIQTVNLRFNKKDKLRNLERDKKQINENLKSYVHSRRKVNSVSMLQDENDTLSVDGNQNTFFSKQKRRNNSSLKNSQQAGVGNLKNFNKMSINELKQHEKGILNLYESQTQRKVTHNKNDNNSNIFDIRLSQIEYDSIFDNPPTFEEKKAFIEVFRKKWREDTGYCSMFDKREAFRQAMQIKRQSANSLVKGTQKRRPQSSMAQIAGKAHHRRTFQSVNPYNQEQILQVEKKLNSDVINVTGSPAKFHNPIQNKEDQNLTNFIHKLYKPLVEVVQQQPLKDSTKSLNSRKGKNGGSLNGSIEIKEYSLNEENNLKDSIDEASSLMKDEHHQRYSFGIINSKEFPQTTQVKQVINLPFPQQKLNTSSQPYSPYSQKFQSINENSAKQIAETQRAESEKDHNVNESQQYLVNKNLLKSHIPHEEQIKSSNAESQASVVRDNEELIQQIQKKKDDKEKEKVPSIFTLPQNPISYSYYKYNFVKNKIENNRLSNLSQVNALQFKLDTEKMKAKLNQPKYQEQVFNYSSQSTSSIYPMLPNHHPKSVMLSKRIKQRNKSMIVQYNKKHEAQQKLNLSQNKNNPQMFTQQKALTRPQTSQGFMRNESLIERRAQTAVGIFHRRKSIPKKQKEFKVIELQGRLGETKTQSTVTQAELTNKDSIDLLINLDLDLQKVQCSIEPADHHIIEDDSIMINKPETHEAGC